MSRVGANFVPFPLKMGTNLLHLLPPSFVERVSSVEVAGHVYNQTNAFVYLGGNVNHSADLSIEVDRRMRSAWCSSRNYTLEQ